MSETFSRQVELAQADAARFREIPRADCVAATREYIQGRRKEIRARHNAGESGGTVLRKLSETADTVLRGVVAFAGASVERGRSVFSRAAVCALGGYGRAELSPHSDLDVCLLYEGSLDGRIEALNGYLIPFLWDIGFDVGYATRSVQDAIGLAKEDMHAFTSLLEGRLVTGDNSTFARLMLSVRELQASSMFDDYVHRKIREREQGLVEPHNDLFTPEPDVKENAGGLRDFHTALWLLMIAYGSVSLDDVVGLGLLPPEEHLELVNALDFIWRIRNELHFHADRAEDRLTFANQRHVAKAFGYGQGEEHGISRLMQDYYGAARRLRAFLRMTCHNYGQQSNGTGPDESALQSNDIVIANGQLHVGQGDKSWFAEAPVRLIEVFWACTRHNAVLSPATQRLVAGSLDLINDTVRANDIARRFFVAICNRPLQAGSALRQMANAGVLGRYMPEFAAVQNVIRYEDFHHYPVDEHTLVALEALARLPEAKGAAAPFLAEALEHLTDPYVLVLAILLHDLGKAAGEVHVDESVQITHEVCRRMGMSGDDEERIAFLVSQHLLMSNIALYRDSDDEDIVRDFANTVKTEQRLRALFLLSYADLAAVGPGVWNDWKGALLLKLYLKAERMLLGKSQRPDDALWDSPKAQEVREHIADSLKPEVEEHLRDLGYRYFAAFRPEQIASHLECVSGAATSGLEVRASKDNEMNMSEVVIATQDRAGLFSQIAGSLASQLIDVNGAALFTRSDGCVVDCFLVSDARHRRPLTERQCAAVKRTLRAVLIDKEDVQALVDNSRRRLFALLQPRVPVRTDVQFDNDSSRTHTVIDIYTGDRTGLLYDITRAMAGAGLDIASARIATDARRVRDAFYVTLNNRKIEDRDEQAAIESAIRQAIHPRPAVEAKGGSS